MCLLIEFCDTHPHVVHLTLGSWGGSLHLCQGAYGSVQLWAVEVGHIAHYLHPFSDVHHFLARAARCMVFNALSNL